MHYNYRTNFRRTYILRMPQFQHHFYFIFEDWWPDFLNDYVSRRAKFLGLNFCGIHIICKNRKITSLKNSLNDDISIRLYEHKLFGWILMYCLPMQLQINLRHTCWPFTLTPLFVLCLTLNNYIP